MGTIAATILNCNLSSLPFTYLGLPTKATFITKEDWQPLIERVDNRLATWKGNALSRGGRFILVNSILSSMPLYFMFFYYFLEWVIHTIEHIHGAFFWKGTRNIHGGMCSINWQLVCTHKNQGGLGACNLWAFNLALLSKWRWNFFMIHMPCGWPLLPTIIIEGGEPMTYKPFSGYMSPF